MHLKHVPRDSPLNRVSRPLLDRMLEAQGERFEDRFSSAGELLEHAAADLRISLPPSESLAGLAGIDAADFADTSYARLVRRCRGLLEEGDLPSQAERAHSAGLATRVHLLRAFAGPDDAVERIKEKVVEVISTFPRQGQDIERGKNPGDVLDPFILAANQFLLYEGAFDAAIGATVSHKALMMIEGLLGHLHEDVIGLMRGNVRVPEPRGRDQEAIDLNTNPFPGADVFQPPLSEGEVHSFHQIKSKTGSAKGGDGKRLGLQLAELRDTYGGEIFYHALVGNTLRGHRSKAGVEKAAPGVVVLVGNASFSVLTRSGIGPQLLLRLYSEAFIDAAEETGYSILTVTEVIAEHFRREAERHGEDFLDVILRKATDGPVREQDSREFRGGRRPRKGTPNKTLF